MSLSIFINDDPVDADLVLNAKTTTSIYGDSTGTFDLAAPASVAAGDSVTLTDENGSVIAFGIVDATTHTSTTVTGSFLPASAFRLLPDDDGPSISPEDYAIIDEFIIDSVAAGHARRL